jgi:Conserved protein/domain typically associated with flavoprotein oxygenases, DIM6/NTAB family
MSFKEVSVSDLSFNPFTKIGKEWMLITSGDENKWNTMTASWGFVGVMWNKNVIETVIRPTRYTIEFVEKNDLFTVSFFDEEYRKALQFCGTHSGRDCDKAKETGLTPIFTDGTTAFAEASMYFVCHKLYAQDMDISLLDKECHKWYEKDAVHKAFIGEIVKAYVKE